MDAACGKRNISEDVIFGNFQSDSYADGYVSNHSLVHGAIQFAAADSTHDQCMLGTTYMNTTNTRHHVQWFIPCCISMTYPYIWNPSYVTQT